jgi:hypothetical protein
MPQRLARFRAISVRAEDARPIASVIELGAENAVVAEKAHVQLRGGEHAEQRRREINPHRAPVPGGERRRDGARGVHAHAGQRRLEDDVRRDEHCAANPGQPSNPLDVRDPQHCRHQHERDRRFGRERDRHPVPSRRGDDVAHLGMSERRAEKQARHSDSGRPTQELEDDVERRVGGRYLAEAKEGQRHARIQMSPGPRAERRVDDCHGGEAHR